MLRAKDTKVAKVPTLRTCAGDICRRMASPMARPTIPKISTSVMAITGLKSIATIIPATIRLKILHFKPLRLPHRMMGSGQITLAMKLKTGM